MKKTKVENAVLALYNFMDKEDLHDSPLRMVHNAIDNQVYEMIKELTELKEKFAEVEEDLNQRKEIMWNNPIFRQGLIKQVVAAVNG